MNLLQREQQRLAEKRELNRGMGDALSVAFELAATTGLFFLIGWGLDRWLGTTPVFMVGLTVFSLTGQIVRLWFQYDAAMRRHEEALLAKRTARRGPRSSGTARDAVGADA